MTNNDGEAPKKTRERKPSEKAWQMIPFVLEKLSSTVEGFTGRFLDMVSESADALIDRGVQKLFGLLCLGAGMVFFLAGGARVLDHALGLPGVGSMIIGVFMILLTALFLLARRP